MRLGLVLAEIGERNKITVPEEDITRAIVERARQVPGREQEVWDYYRKNPAAVAHWVVARRSRIPSALAAWVLREAPLR